MMGGEWFTKLFGDSPDPHSLADIAIKDVSKTLKIADRPSSTKVSILKNCIPQYVVGKCNFFSYVQKSTAISLV